MTYVSGPPSKMRPLLFAVVDVHIFDASRPVLSELGFDAGADREALQPGVVVDDAVIDVGRASEKPPAAKIMKLSKA